MKKSLRKISCILALTLGMTTLSGCGGKVAGVDVNGMISRYSTFCELGEYKGIEYNEQKTVVTDEMIQAEIDDLIDQYSTSENLTTGTANNGDTVNIDFVGKIDGVEFEGGSTEGAGYDLTLGEGRFIPGMEDKIVGHNVGDTFDINVTFPTDYYMADMAGKEAVFSVTINHIVKVTKPEYNDAFVAVNTEQKTVAEYEENLKKTMTEYYASSDESFNKSTIMDIVLGNANVTEYPEKDMKELINGVIENVQKEADESGYDFGLYVTSVYGMASEENFRSYLAEQAKDYMKEKIVICAIAKQENIKVTKDDVKEIKEKIMENTGLSEKELKEQYPNKDLVYYALSEKVYQFLLDNGKGVPATSTDAE